MIEQSTSEQPGSAALQALQEEGSGIVATDAETKSVTGETALDEHGGLYGAPKSEGVASIPKESDIMPPAKKVIEPESETTPKIVNTGTTIEGNDSIFTAGEKTTDQPLSPAEVPTPLPPNNEVKPAETGPLPKLEEVEVPQVVPSEMTEEVSKKTVGGNIEPVAEIDKEFDSRTEEIQSRFEEKVPEPSIEDIEDPEKRFEARKGSATEVIQSMIKDLDEIDKSFDERLVAAERKFELAIGESRELDKEADLLEEKMKSKREQAFKMRTNAENELDREKAAAEGGKANVAKKRSDLESLQM